LVETVPEVVSMWLFVLMTIESRCRCGCCSWVCAFYLWFNWRHHRSRLTSFNKAMTSTTLHVSSNSSPPRNCEFVH